MNYFDEQEAIDKERRRKERRREEIGDVIQGICYIIGIALYLSLWVGIVYVIIHFILKFW
jgi:hypothetical protein